MINRKVGKDIICMFSFKNRAKSKGDALARPFKVYFLVNYRLPPHGLLRSECYQLLKYTFMMLSSI